MIPYAYGTNQAGWLILTAASTVVVPDVDVLKENDVRPRTLDESGRSVEIVDVVTTDTVRHVESRDRNRSPNSQRLCGGSQKEEGQQGGQSAHHEVLGSQRCGV